MYHLLLGAYVNDTELLNNLETSTSVICNGTHSDCNGHGTCRNGACVCGGFYTGSNCETHFEVILGNSYKAFRFIFLSIFVILACVTAFQAFKSFYFWKSGKIVYRLKFLNHLVVLVFELLRVIYFICDPWGNDNFVPKSADEILYNLPIYFLFTAYIVLLIYWCHTYSVISYKLKPKGLDNTTKKRTLLKAIPIFIFINVVWFVFELVRIILGGIGRVKGNIYNNAYNAWVGVACFSTLICFSIYGSLLIKKIKLLPTSEKEKTSTVRRLTFITISVSVSLFISILPPILFFFLGFYNSPEGMLTNVSVVHGIEAILTIELLYIMKPKEVFNNNNSDSERSKKKSNNITKSRSESVSYYKQQNGTPTSGNSPRNSPRRYSKEVKDHQITYNNNNSIITPSTPPYSSFTNYNQSPSNPLYNNSNNNNNNNDSNSSSNLNSSNDDIINHQDHTSNSSNNETSNDNSNVTTETENEIMVINNQSNIQNNNNNNQNDINNNNIEIDILNQDGANIEMEEYDSIDQV